MRQNILIALLVISPTYSTKLINESGMGLGYEYPSENGSIQTHNKIFIKGEKISTRVRSENRVTTNNGIFSLSQGILEVGFDYIAFSKITIFATNELNYNTLRSINNIYLSGAGVKYQLVSFKNFDFDSSLAALYNRTMYDDGSVNSSPSISVRNRINNYFDNSKLTLQHYYISPMSFKEVSLSIFNIEYLSRVYTNTDFKLGMQYTYNYVNREFINAFYGMVILSID